MDSTRKGKRFPDSMSKTIPIWTCVLNRCIRNHLNKSNDVALLNDGVSNVAIWSIGGHNVVTTLIIDDSSFVPRCDSTLEHSQIGLYLLDIVELFTRRFYCQDLNFF